MSAKHIFLKQRFEMFFKSKGFLLFLFCFLFFSMIFSGMVFANALDNSVQNNYDENSVINDNNITDLSSNVVNPTDNVLQNINPGSFTVSGIVKDYEDKKIPIEKYPYVLISGWTSQSDNNPIYWSKLELVKEDSTYVIDGIPEDFTGVLTAGAEGYANSHNLFSPEGIANGINFKLEKGIECSFKNDDPGIQYKLESGSYCKDVNGNEVKLDGFSINIFAKDLSAFGLHPNSVFKAKLKENIIIYNYDERSTGGCVLWLIISANFTDESIMSHWLVNDTPLSGDYRIDWTIPQPVTVVPQKMLRGNMKINGKLSDIGSGSPLDLSLHPYAMLIGYDLAGSTEYIETCNTTDIGEYQFVDVPKSVIGIVFAGASGHTNKASFVIYNELDPPEDETIVLDLSLYKGSQCTFNPQLGFKGIKLLDETSIKYNGFDYGIFIEDMDITDWDIPPVGLPYNSVINFDENGKAIYEYSSEEDKLEIKLVLQVIPDDSYLFDKWKIGDTEFTQGSYIPDKGDFTLETCFEGILCPVTVDLNGGRLTDAQKESLSQWNENKDGTWTRQFLLNTTYEDAMSDWEDIIPTKTDIHFKCWDPEPGDQQIKIEGVTFTAQYAHKVTFDPANGDDPWDVFVNDGSKVNKPEDPKYADYIFDGWFEEGAKTSFDFNTLIRDDKTLIAHWIGLLSVSGTVIDFDGGKIPLEKYPYVLISGWIGQSNDNPTYWSKIAYVADDSTYTIEGIPVDFTGVLTAGAEGYANSHNLFSSEGIAKGINFELKKGIECSFKNDDPGIQYKIESGSYCRDNNGNEVKLDGFSINIFAKDLSAFGLHPNSVFKAKLKENIIIYNYDDRGAGGSLLWLRISANFTDESIMSHWSVNDTPLVNEYRIDWSTPQPVIVAPQKILPDTMKITGTLTDEDATTPLDLSQHPYAMLIGYDLYKLESYVVTCYANDSGQYAFFNVPKTVVGIVFAGAAGHANEASFVSYDEENPPKDETITVDLSLQIGSQCTFKPMSGFKGIEILKGTSIKIDGFDFGEFLEDTDITDWDVPPIGLSYDSKLYLNADGKIIYEYNSVPDKVEIKLILQVIADDGHLFDKWRIGDDEFTELTYVPDKGDFELEVYFKDILCPVTVNLNGGSITDAEKESLSQWDENKDGTWTRGFILNTTYADAMSDWEDIIPSKTDIHFNGWDPEPGDQQLKKDGVTFTAQYAHKVTFDPANGDDSWDVLVNDGSKVTKPEDPEYIDHSFVGWFEEYSETPFDFNTQIKDDLILTAHWVELLSVSGTVIDVDGEKIPLEKYPYVLISGWTGQSNSNPIYWSKLALVEDDSTYKIEGIPVDFTGVLTAGAEGYANSHNLFSPEGIAKGINFELKKGVECSFKNDDPGIQYRIESGSYCRDINGNEVKLDGFSIDIFAKDLSAFGLHPNSVFKARLKENIIIYNYDDRGTGGSLLWLRISAKFTDESIMSHWLVNDAPLFDEYRIDWTTPQPVIVTPQKMLPDTMKINGTLTEKDATTPLDLSQHPYAMLIGYDLYNSKEYVVTCYANDIGQYEFVNVPKTVVGIVMAGAAGHANKASLVRYDEENPPKDETITVDLSLQIGSQCTFMPMSGFKGIEILQGTSIKIDGFDFGEFLEDTDITDWDVPPIGLSYDSKLYLDADGKIIYEYNSVPDKVEIKLILQVIADDGHLFDKWRIGDDEFTDLTYVPDKGDFELEAYFNDRVYPEVVNLTIDFVAAEPEIVDPTHSNSQTGDSLFWILLAAAILCFVGLTMFSLNKLINRGYVLQGNHFATSNFVSGKQEKIFNYSRININLPKILILTILLILSLSGIGILLSNNNAFANAKSTLEPDSNKIIATVYDDGSVSFSKCKLTNNTENVYELYSSCVSVNDEAKSVYGIEDAKITINGFDGILYDDVPNGYPHSATGLSCVLPGESTELSVSVDSLDKQSCLALVGKSVYNVTLNTTKSITANVDLTDEGVIAYGSSVPEGWTEVAGSDMKKFTKEVSLNTPYESVVEDWDENIIVHATQPGLYHFSRFLPSSGIMKDNTTFTPEFLTNYNYQVCILGIGQDKCGDQGEEIAHLTFGPATGESDACLDHDGKHEHCIHNEDWKTIIKNCNDGHADWYEDCLNEGCTKSVPLLINGDLGGMPKDKELCSVLESFAAGGNINDAYLNWNAMYIGDCECLNWSSSRIRATLNGIESMDPYNPSEYADPASCLDSSNCLLSCFPKDLAEAIKPKYYKVPTKWDYSTYEIQSSVDVKDKLWLLSAEEIYGNNVKELPFKEYGYNQYTKKINDGISWYATSFKNNSVWLKDGNRPWWIRSPYRDEDFMVGVIGNDGKWNYNTPNTNNNGLAPCFCL